MLHIRTSQQIFEQIERCGIEPLQIVEEQGERMLRPREYTDKSTEHQPEPALLVLWRKFRDRWLFSYDELQLGDEIHDELPGRTYRLTKGIAPFPQIPFALTQEGT